MALEGFRLNRRALLDPLLELQARRAGRAVLRHEGAKRIDPFRAFERGAERPGLTQHERQTRGGFKGRAILAEKFRLLQALDDEGAIVRANRRGVRDRLWAKAIESGHAKVEKEK